MRNAYKRSAAALRQARWRSKQRPEDLLRQLRDRMQALRARRRAPRRYPDLATLRAYRLGRLSLAAYLAAARQTATSPGPLTTRTETP